MTQGDSTQKYSDYPQPILLAERLEILNSVLHWRKVPLSGSDQASSDLLAISPAFAGKPASRSPQFSWFGTFYQTMAVTWAVAYGRYPKYRLVLRGGPGSASNDLRNIMQVQPYRVTTESAYVEYFFQSGLVGVLVVPKVLRGSQQTKVSREVHCRMFPDISQASAWAEQKRQELAYTEHGLPETIPPLGLPGNPKKPRRYVTLPSESEEAFFPSLDIAELQCSIAPLPAFSPIKLDMLSYRACERFVGSAVNFCRENDGKLHDGQSPGAYLEVRLGAVDGAWSLRTTTVLPFSNVIHHTRTSQEAALAPFSVTARVRVGRSPGGAPKALRMALLEAYRATPPTTEERRTAMALLTAARIPVLGQSLTKKQAPKRLVPDGLPESAARIPLPLFLAELASRLDFSLFRPVNSPLGDIQGVLLVVQRTRGGFLFRLHGGEIGIGYGLSLEERLERIQAWEDCAEYTPNRAIERKEVRLIAKKLYPARVGATAFRKVRTKTIHRSIVRSLEGISKLSTTIANKITERLSLESGWNAVKERKEKELHKKIPTLANRQFATKGTKNTFTVAIDGTEMKLTEALKKYNHVVSYQTARVRITSYGWTAKAAVSTPAHGKKPSRKPGPTPTPPSPGRP